MHSVMILKVKFVQNLAMLDMSNNSSSETLLFDPDKAIGILDLRSLAYYKIELGVIQQKLSRFYNFESAEVCVQFNNLINTVRRGQKETSEDKYPWLDESDK